MATIPQLIAYLRNCYEADNRETGIPNLLQSKHRHVAFVEGEDALLRGLVSNVAIDPAIAELAQKEAHLYRRDKTLVFAALMFVGPGTVSKRLTKQVCAPLVFFPSEFKQSNDVLVLEPRIDEPRLNYPVLAALAGDARPEDIDSLQRELPALPWDRTTVHTLAAILAEMFPEVDFTPLASFPKLADGDAVRHAAAGKELCCLPACAMALIPNSPDTRGVLYELAELSKGELSLTGLSMTGLSMTGLSEVGLSKSPKYSSALRALLDPSDTPVTATDNQNEWPVIPAVLSAAQQRVLRSARQNTLTFVNGPPGTGKSYTIGAVALDHLSRGETVLIASRNDQAVDVVADKIEALMGTADSIVRAGRKEHLRQLKRSLERILGGVRSHGPEQKSAKTLKRELNRLDGQMRATELALRSLFERHIRWGELAESPPASFISRISGDMRRRILDWQLDRAPQTWKLVESYHELVNRRARLASDLLSAVLDQRVDGLLENRRDHLTAFLQAIRVRGDAKQQRLFSVIDFSILLHAFPVWLTKISDLANVLPATCELFDVAIIDEATQCDLASALPLLQRAKRIVVVGDPKQLRHVSFLSDRRQVAFACENELDDTQQSRFHFRDKSVLDAVQESITRQDNVVFLNEHFRSLPGIIRFSNDEFYGGALHVMRQRPETINMKCVEVVHVVDGVRERSGANKVEATALVEKLSSLIAEEADLPSPTSIGVLSPFRDQANYLSEQINRAFSHRELEKHDLLVGTAHAFQGEERDVMLLSFAADSGSHAATFRFLSNPNVFNVSTTRARHRQIVFKSFDVAELPGGSLLGRFVVQTESDAPGVTAAKQSNVRDAFCESICRSVREAGLDAWANYPVAGLEMDVVVRLPGGASIGVDLVGYPGQYIDSYSLERYRMMERAGMRVVPVAYREWKASKEGCLEALNSVLRGR